MVRMSKPALVDPATAHEQHDLSRRGIARIKSLRQQVEDNSRQKALGGKPPYLSGPWLDAEAGPRLARAMHEAGVIIDETTLGDFSPAIAAAQTATQYSYLWSINTTIADPGNGAVRANNATPTSATQLAISLYDRNNVARPVFAQLAGGDEIALYASGDLATWVKFSLDAAPTVQANSWLQLSVTYLDQGTDGFAPLNNADVEVVIRTTAAGDALTPAEGDARYVNVPGDSMSGPLGINYSGIQSALRVRQSGGTVEGIVADSLSGLSLRNALGFATYRSNDASIPTFRVDGNNGQVYGGGSVPTVTQGANLGTPGPVTVSWGNGTFMYLILNPSGTGQAAGTQCTVTFFSARSSATYGVWIQPHSTNAADLNWYPGGQSGSSFVIGCRSALTAGQAYHLGLWIAGMGA